MSPNLKCPVCGVEVPDTGMFSQIGMGTPDGALNLQPPRQHAACANGHRLVRNPESDELGEWRRLDEDIQA